MKEEITHLGHYPEGEIHRIAFLGGSEWEEGSEVYNDAFNTAKLLAENGYSNVNGGGPGVMRAATNGAHAGGQKVLGVTYRPSYRHKNFEGVDQKNEFDEEVLTIDYFDRTKVMLQNSDVHILFKGGTGTISEFGMTWASSRIHAKHSKPIILFGDFWKDILKELEKNMKIREGERELLKIVATPQEALDCINSLSNK